MNKLTMTLMLVTGLQTYAMDHWYLVAKPSEWSKESKQQQAVQKIPNFIMPVVGGIIFKNYNNSVDATSAPEKKFLGVVRAPIDDVYMHRYIGWQREGELPLMNDELIRLEHDINSSWGLSLERFKWERRKSFLEKVIANDLTQTLAIVRHGTLAQAEQVVDQLEHPPTAQFDDSYMKMKQEEWILARQILERRADYKQKIRHQIEANLALEKQQELAKKQTEQSFQPESKEALVAHSESVKKSEVTHLDPAPTTQLAEGGIYQNNNLEFKKDFSDTCDLILTTPADINSRLRSMVTADPQTEFPLYMQQVRNAYTAGFATSKEVLLFARDFSQGIAQHVMHITNHPQEYASDFVHSNMELLKQAMFLVIDVYGQSEGLVVSEQEMALYEASVKARAEKVIQLYNHLCEKIPQMSRKELADISSQIVVDTLLLNSAGKVFSSLKNIKLPSTIASNELFSGIEHRLASLATPEGLIVRVPQNLSEASMLKSAAEKVVPRGTEELETASKAAAKGTTLEESVANMKQVFEGSDFGKALQKCSVKTKFVDAKTNSQIYEVTEKLPGFGLKEGDQFYLDKFHGDHIEVYRNKKCIDVLNLDGSRYKNVDKALGRDLKAK